MEIAYLHLVTNHIPIIGVPFALAMLAIAVWRNSSELKAVSFLAFAVVGALTLGVFLLGQGGEDFVEDLSGVVKETIEDHESAATIALVSTAVLSVISLFALIRYGGFAILRPRFRKRDEALTDIAPRFSAWIVFTVLALAVLSSGILGYTGRLGGKIRHPEFHGGAAATNGDERERDNDRGRDRRGRDDD